MTKSGPTKNELKAIASRLGITLTDNKLEAFYTAMQPTWEAYKYVCNIDCSPAVVTYARTHVQQPTKKDNPYNAWYYKTEINGARTGKLLGKTFAIKDNTNVAGVPMMNGAHSLANYIPCSDATIVTRILDEGGIIKGKAHCECFCFSGVSYTNATGPVLNPHKTTHSSGGSSSGSAVLVACGEVDMATGGDQGGSIRIPASWSGICGMKPTYGLVPYTGIMPIEKTLDHAGPMTKSVADNALLLEVLAGYDDGLDPRQHPAIQSKAYTASLDKTIKGIKIGILKQGFAQNNSERIVDSRVKEAAIKLGSLGATISMVDCALHETAPLLFSPIVIEGAYDLMLKGNAYGSNYKGLYDIALMNAHSKWPTQINTLDESIQLMLLMADYAKETFHGISYAKARHGVTQLRKAYDRLFQKVDVLLMPTTPMRATPLANKTTSLVEYLGKTLEMVGNTCAFNLTGHPAFSIPCGSQDDLPIGMMLVGNYFDEPRLYQVAHAFEQNRV